MAFQHLAIKGMQIADRRDAKFFHARLGNLPDTRYPAYRQAKKESLDFVGLNDEEAVRLLPI
jgi:hypothetical protein